MTPNENLALLTAASHLLSQIERVNDSPEYQAVWTIAQMHVGPYTGPTYINEMAALQKVLKEYATIIVAQDCETNAQHDYIYATSVQEEALERFYEEAKPSHEFHHIKEYP